jgi:NDP-sugar pyrophosphorylase family protein
MEAIVLAGGRAERLGESAAGLPKPLVPVAGRPLLAHQVRRLAAAGVSRVIVACARGQEPLFTAQLEGHGAEIVPAGEPEPLGRGGGFRFAARFRRESGDFLGLNGDELVDVDFGALLALHASKDAAATVAVARPRSPFGVVELDGERITGFSEGGETPYWVSCGIYALGDDALARFPERGDHETTAFPRLAEQGRLFAYRHEGLWLTVNTPKELRLASEYLERHPDWLAA